MVEKWWKEMGSGRVVRFSPRRLASLNSGQMGRTLPDIVFNADPLMNGRVAGVRFLGSHMGLMEPFECGNEACSAGLQRAAPLTGVPLQWRGSERSRLP